MQFAERTAAAKLCSFLSSMGNFGCELRRSEFADTLR